MHDSVDEPQLDPARLEALRLAAGAGPVLILTHDNPDPDGLAAGKTLAVLLEQAWSIPSRLRYCGLVNRAENQAMLKRITPGWRHSEHIRNVSRYSAVALVDTQPGAGNNSLPEDVIPQIVFDHHSTQTEAVARVPFVDIRADVGATVSIVYQYLAAAGITPDSLLATAVFYGIQTDTRGLTRAASPLDQRIYFGMLQSIDRSLLLQVEQAWLPREYFQTFVHGLQAARVFGRVVISSLGPVHRPDFPAELADILVRLEDSRAVLCMGHHDGTLYLSMRISEPRFDAGRLIRKVIVEGGHAGGHGMIGGGRVSLDGRNPDELAAEIERRFLKVMGESKRPAQPLL